MPETYHYIDDNGQSYTHSEPTSIKLQPFKLRQVYNGVEHYENDLYDVSKRSLTSGFFIGDSPYIILGIINRDQTARHDWREFQQIKSMLAGKDWEGIELYPAESRLVDPSNEFFLWCVPAGVLKYGLTGGRRVWKPSKALAPQRPFPT